MIGKQSIESLALAIALLGPVSVHATTCRAELQRLESGALAVSGDTDAQGARELVLEDENGVVVQRIFSSDESAELAKLPASSAKLALQPVERSFVELASFAENGSGHLRARFVDARGESLCVTEAYDVEAIAAADALIDGQASLSVAEVPSPIQCSATVTRRVSGGYLLAGSMFIYPSLDLSPGPYVNIEFRSGGQRVQLLRALLRRVDDNVYLARFKSLATFPILPGQRLNVTWHFPGFIPQCAAEIVVAGNEPTRVDPNQRQRPTSGTGTGIN
jgi:hypothetical protein